MNHSVCAATTICLFMPWTDACELSAATAAAGVVAVSGEDVLFDGEPVKVIGLRTSNALMSDRATEELVDALDSYADFGVNAVAVYVMGSRFGDVRGYRADGRMEPAVANRLERVLTALEEREMIAIVGCLYWNTSRAREQLAHWHQADAEHAIAKTAAWLIDRDFRHVIFDPDNEGMAVAENGWSAEALIAAAKSAAPGLVVANNTKQNPANEDLNIHFGRYEPGKPWIESEGTPPYGDGISYWKAYSKQTHLEDPTYYNYSRIGRYTAEMKAAQLAATRRAIEQHSGYVLASTWLQCGPEEGVGGPFVSPGGTSDLGSSADRDGPWNRDIDVLHPDAGVRWWLEAVADMTE